MAIKAPSVLTIPKDRYLYNEVLAYAKSQRQEENINFLFAKDNNQTLYTKYISAASLEQVNLKARRRKDWMRWPNRRSGAR